MQQQQNPEGNQNNQTGQQTKQKQSKRGKPKGMNGFPKLEKSQAWSSIQQSTQIIQALTRFGRFINFQQTGKKTKQQQINTNQENGIFINNEQLNIVRVVADICQASQKNNKNCFVFFFASDYPEFIIENGVPRLLNNYEEYAQFDPLFQIAPLITNKFLQEFALYLQVENGESNVRFQDLFERVGNKKLQTADTILQANFVKFLLEPRQWFKFQDKNQFQQQIHETYGEYIALDICKHDYEKNIMELLGCMQTEDNTDQYQDQQQQYK